MTTTGKDNQQDERILSLEQEVRKLQLELRILRNAIERLEGLEERP
jgi:hypothetical protein